MALLNFTSSDLKFLKVPFNLTRSHGRRDSNEPIRIDVVFVIYLNCNLINQYFLLQCTIKANIYVYKCQNFQTQTKNFNQKPTHCKLDSLVPASSKIPSTSSNLLVKAVHYKMFLLVILYLAIC